MKAIGVCYMAKKEFDAINTRFDKIIEGLTEIKVETAGIKEHLKTLNGKVVEHEKKFNSIDNNFVSYNNGRLACQDGFRTEINKLREDFIKENKEQDKEAKNIETMLWNLKIQVAGIAVVVPIVMSFLLWLIQKLL